MNSQDKITPDDQWPVTVQTFQRGDHLIIDFGRPIAWIWLRPAEALQFANTIIQHIREMK